MLPYMQLFPAGNSPGQSNDGGLAFNAFDFNSPQDISSNIYTARMDVNITQKRPSLGICTRNAGGHFTMTSVRCAVPRATGFLGATEQQQGNRCRIHRATVARIL